MNTASVTRKNLKRLRFVLTGVFLVEVLFLLQVERVRLIENAHEHVVVSYALHLSLAIFTLLLFLFLFLYRQHPLMNHPTMTRVVPFSTFIILIISAVISLFAQVTDGHITLFTVHLLTFGLILFVRPWWNLVIYTIPFTLYLTGVLAFQDSQDLMMTHIINGSIIYLGVLFSSTVFYKHLIHDLESTATLMAQNEQLEQLATLDPLTALPNRRYFEQKLHYESSINRRYKQEASLIIVDIDYFKAVNDTYGHDVGDDILKTLGQIMKNSVRETDTVCRWGGEEFMILLSHTEIFGAVTLAERLRKTVEDHAFKVGEHTLNITLSLGIARLAHEHEDGFKHSYANVDSALYQAKNKGRNQIAVHKDH